MDALTSKNLDAIMGQWGLTRGAGENDDHLRTRLKVAMTWPQAMNASYMRLCYLLVRLDVKSARRDLPMGVM